MGELRRVEKGDQVAVHYTLKLKDGTTVQSSKDEEPLKFAAGGTDVIEPISAGVIGMTPGEEKDLTVPPEKGFGERDEELVQEIPRERVPRDTKEGDRLSDQQSDKVWTVRELKHDSVVLDGNHPLAGHILVFQLEVASVE